MIMYTHNIPFPHTRQRHLQKTPRSEPFQLPWELKKREKDENKDVRVTDLLVSQDSESGCWDFGTCSVKVWSDREKIEQER